MKTTFRPLLLGLALASFGCTADVGEGTGASTVLETGDCVVEGFGTLPAGDEFDGMAMGIGDGFAEGTWVHLGPETVVGGGSGSGRDDDDDDDIDEGIDEDSDGPRDWGDEDDDLPGEGCRGERRGHREGRGEGHDRHEGRGRGHHCGCDDDDHDDDDDDDDDEPPVTTQDRFEGVVEGIFCSINGSRVGTVTGSGSWNGDSGYTFEVFVNDGGPTNDEYTFTVIDSTGAIVYSVNGFPDTGDLTVAAF